MKPAGLMVRHRLSPAKSAESRVAPAAFPRPAASYFGERIGSMKTRKFLVSVLTLAPLLVVAVRWRTTSHRTSQRSPRACRHRHGRHVLWMLIAGFLVFFMQAGFALVETGFTRTKNVAHTMMMNLMVFCIGALGYWLVGFAFQFGGANHTYPALHGHDAFAFSPTSLGSWTGKLENELMIAGHGVLGLSGFMLHGLLSNYGVMAFFLFSLVFMTPPRRSRPAQ